MRDLLVVLILLISSVNAYAVGFTDDRLNGLNTSIPLNELNICCGTGLIISTEQWAGPRFTLSQPTQITEIGGFVSYNGPSPFIVTIRPQINGIPDITTALASLTLSNNFPRGIGAYESVSPNLLLGTGTYYAMFQATTEESQGGLLQDIQNDSGIPYSAVVGPSGIAHPLAGEARDEQFALAVRITGETGGSVPIPDTMTLLAVGLIPSLALYFIAPRIRRSLVA